jgi:hypothetical protein
MSDDDLRDPDLFPGVDPDMDLEQARHIVAQGGEAGFTDRQIEQAQDLLDSEDLTGDPILKDFDTLYSLCEELTHTLVEQADLRIDRAHHRPSLRDTLNDLDLVDRFLELFKLEMDPRHNPDVDPQA